MLSLLCANHGFWQTYFYEKNNSSSKAGSKRTTTKEIKFRPSTDVGDYNIKLKKIKSFILGGDKTKISVRLEVEKFLIVKWV